jgi:hypothetical protein
MSHCLLRRTHVLRRLLPSRPVTVAVPTQRNLTACPARHHQTPARSLNPTSSAPPTGSASSPSAHTEAIAKLVRTLCASKPRLPKSSATALPASSKATTPSSDDQPTARPASALPQDHILSAYNTLRNLDIVSFASLPPARIIHIINRAALSKSRATASSLCEDLPALAASQSPHDFLQVVQQLVLSFSYAHILTSAQAWHVLHVLGEDRIAGLRASAIEALGSLIGQSSPPPQHHLAAAATVCANVMIANFPVPSQKDDAPGRSYGQALARVGNLLVLLGHMGQQKVVYDLLTALFKAERVPRSILQTVDFSATDPRTIILDVVTNASLNWGYVDIAEAMFYQHFPRLPVLRVGLDVVSDLIASGSYDKLRRSRQMLVTMLSHPQMGRISDELLQKFYEAAAARNLGEVAEDVYAASQQVVSQQAPDSVPYPTPQGEPLNWLMRYLVLNSMNDSLARQLARHVVSSGYRLPLQQRAGFITLVAQKGFASEARALWEAYASGEDAHVVTGNAAATIRLVSLYVHLAEAQTAKMGVANIGDNAPESIRAHEDHGGKTSRVASDVSAPAFTASDRRASAPHLLDGSENRVASEHRLAADAYLHDLEAFGRRVFNAYRDEKTPTEHASHRDLTSLARMSFMLKDHKQGFAALGAILDRKEIPDIYDVNVALSAMAAQNPREAGALLRRMRRHGLQPDGVTFGTVIHHAFLQEDYPLVRWLVSYARWLDGGEMSLRAIKSLIHTSLRDKGVSREARRHNLRRCRQVLAALSHEPDVATASLGLLGIRAALDLNDPRTAFDFWVRYVKTRTDWGSRLDRKLRVQMAIQIRRRREQGSLSTAESKGMLDELREDE